MENSNRWYLLVNFLHGLVGPGNEIWVTLGSSPVPLKFPKVIPTRPDKLLLDRLGRRVGPIREHSKDIPTLEVRNSLEETAEGRRESAVVVSVISSEHLRLRLLLWSGRWLLPTASVFTTSALLGGQTDAGRPGRRTAGGLGHGVGELS